MNHTPTLKCNWATNKILGGKCSDVNFYKNQYGNIACGEHAQRLQVASPLNDNRWKIIAKADVK